MIADFRAALAALILAFAPTSVAAQQPDKPKVVATFTILADLARQIGGDRVMVETIVGANADAHSDRNYTRHTKEISAWTFVLNSRTESAGGSE